MEGEIICIISEDPPSHYFQFFFSRDWHLTMLLLCLMSQKGKSQLKINEELTHCYILEVKAWKRGINCPWPRMKVQTCLNQFKCAVLSGWSHFPDRALLHTSMRTCAAEPAHVVPSKKSYMSSCTSYLLKPPNVAYTSCISFSFACVSIWHLTFILFEVTYTAKFSPTNSHQQYYLL